MPAYQIVDTQIENADECEKYKALAKPITEQYGGVYRARGANMGVLETGLVYLHIRKTLPLTFVPHKTKDGRIIYTDFPKRCFRDEVSIYIDLHPIYGGKKHQVRYRKN